MALSTTPSWMMSAWSRNPSGPDALYAVNPYATYDAFVVDVSPHWMSARSPSDTMLHPPGTFPVGELTIFTFS